MRPNLKVELLNYGFAAPFKKLRFGYIVKHGSIYTRPMPCGNYLFFGFMHGNGRSIRGTIFTASAQDYKNK
jgi:hypothetical protein